jgi:hypothetical protein
MPSGTLYLVTLVRTDVSENISPPFLMVEEHCLLECFLKAVSIIEAFWLYRVALVRTDVSENIAYIFSVP